MKKCMFLLFFLWVHTALAGGPSPSLSLKQAWEMMLANNLNLQQLDQKLRQLQLEERIQKTQFLPSFGTSVSYHYISETARLTLPFQIPGVPMRDIEAGVKNQYDLAVFVNQPIFTGFRTRNLVKLAQSQKQATQLQKKILQNQLLFQTGQLYYSIQLNLLQQQVLQKSIERVGLQLQKVRNFFLADQATAFDTLEVANRKLQLQNQRQKLRSLQLILLSKLRHVLNAETLPTIQPIAPEKTSLKLDSLGYFLDQAWAYRPELQRLASLQKAQSFRIKATQSALLPQVYANFSYHYAKPGVNFFANEWMSYYTVGVNLQWQLWNWKRDQYRVQQARLEMQNLSLEQQNLVREIQQQVEEAYQHLQTTREQIQLQKQFVAQERERYRITENRYDQGLATPLDLRSAENSLTGAELQLQQNYIEWFQFRLQLEVATGEIGKNLN